MTSPAIEARMRASIAADHPFEFSEETPDEARAVPRRARPAVQGRDRRRPRAPPPSATATPMPPTTFYRQGPFIDLCRGPHVASTGKIGPFKLLGIAGRVLARRREAPDAPARLRHGLGDPGGPRRLPVAPGGGEEARPPTARASSSTCSRFHDVSPGSAFWHPKGQRIWRTLESGHARAPGASRVPGGIHARSS